MNLDTIKAQQAAHREHQAYVEAFDALLKRFGECMVTVTDSIVSHFAALGLHTVAEDGSPHRWEFTFPPTEGWIGIEVLAHPTFNAEELRSELIHPRSGDPGVIIKPLTTTAIPVEIRWADANGVHGWVSNIWWKVPATTSGSQRLRSSRFEESTGRESFRPRTRPARRASSQPRFLVRNRPKWQSCDAGGTNAYLHTLPEGLSSRCTIRQGHPVPWPYAEVVGFAG